MQPKNLTPKETKEYERWNATPPTSQEHGTQDDISRNMVQLRPNSWRLEGNKLIGMTNFGQLVQYIPTNYVCKGTDSRGLPILEKIV